ncbi:MAG: SDR family oxidoreductase [Flavobacteriaceae bacterium]
MNKIALVTGGSRGLGKDMALSFAKNNIDVILTYHNSKSEANKIVAEIEKMGQKAIALPFDISKSNAIDPFVETLATTLRSHWNTQSFDYLVNNAGVGATIPMAQVTEEQFDTLMNVHYRGVYFLTQKCLPMMNDFGCVIFISSGTTRFCVPGYSVYSSLKAAIENLSKYVAKEYGSRGIRSNVIAPGPVETDFNNAAIRNNPQMKAFLSGNSPLGRVGNADDIGSVVAFVCSEEAKWINGQRIEVSGGINL